MILTSVPQNKEKNMTIQQLRYVLEIAKTGSFSEAAKQLFVAQSSLSVSVKALERELNIKIFERSNNGVFLTDEGSEFVKYASSVVDSEDFITMRYRDRRATNKLHIATQHYDFIADIFGNFVKNQTSEGYSFSLKEIETHSVVQEVETGKSDIGIIAIKEGDFDIMKRYLEKRGLTFSPMLKALPHVFVRREHPLAKNGRLSYAELQKYPYVSYEQGEHNSSYFTEEMLDSLSSEKHIEISDRATLMNLLLITDAYTVGTGIMPSALNKGDIVSVPLVCDDCYIIGYVLNGSRKISDIAEKFIEILTAFVIKIKTERKENSESTC